jgi:pimeloyl-ACP methyl ester carboxylesterase
MDATNQAHTSTLKVIADHGSGRSFITVIDGCDYRALGSAVTERISQRARSILIEAPSITVDNWRELARSLEVLLASLGIRQASFVGLGSGAALVENLALENPKVVRSLVVVDSALQAHPTLWQRFVDSIERNLPFGLPLRLGSRGFNVRAYAHRLRCPLLAVETRRASSFIRSELESLGMLAPTAWTVALAASEGDEEISELGDLVWAFQDAPAKCPQKNRQEVA